MRAFVAIVACLALGSVARAGEDGPPPTFIDTTTTETTLVPTTSTVTTTTAAVATTTTVFAPTTTTLLWWPPRGGPPTTFPSPTTTTTVPPPACDAAVPGTCDDGNPCTFDSCAGAFLGCVHRPLTGDPCPDDGVLCTEDRCVAGTCAHPPADLRCDEGACEMRSCQPGHPKADAAGCVRVRGHGKTDGTPCTHDGLSCTDDVCRDGACVHLPVDARCVPPGLCVAAKCAPGRNADADGCAVGPPRNDGQSCAEDGNACTLDVCRTGECAHEPESDAAALCSPVQHAFESALALGAGASELRMEAEEGGPSLAAGLPRLDAVAAQVDAAARVLAGHDPYATALAAGPAQASTMVATDRARIAFTMVLRTPQQISGFLRTLAQARARGAVSQPVRRHLRRRGRALLHTARVLKTNLRVLQQ
jgi:hypothetical protein